MKDDDPEKRIRELERQLADATRTAQSPPYTGDAPPYMGDAIYLGDSPHEPGLSPPRRRTTYPWLLVFVVLGILVPVVVSLVGLFVRSTPSRSTLGNGARTTAPSSGPTVVPEGGELRVGGNLATKTIVCNDGNLTFYGYGSKYSVTGHCASLKVGGYNNNVIVDSADTLESSGYGNTVTVHACNNGNLRLSAYGIAFDVTGHCASLTISSYDNKVTVDSVDGINVSGYNNTVTYHSGAPKIADSGYSNTIQQG
jgi:Protein of unknown function (DUF3060)